MIEVVIFHMGLEFNNNFEMETISHTKNYFFKCLLQLQITVCHFDAIM